MGEREKRLSFGRYYVTLFFSKWLLFNGAEGKSDAHTRSRYWPSFGQWLKSNDTVRKFGRGRHAICQSIAVAR